MRIGFCGAHRTGKSTLARIIAEQLGIHFHVTNISQAPIWKETQTSPSDIVTFAERLKIQFGLLDYLKEQYEKAEKAFVADRTPLDLLGYLFASLDHTCSDLWSNATRSYVDKVIDLTQKHFDKIFLVQPGIPVVPEVGKEGEVFLGDIYRTAINNNMLAFGVNYLENFHIIPSQIINLEDRIRYILEKLKSLRISKLQDL
jgi:hypothetical protein